MIFWQLVGRLFALCVENEQAQTDMAMSPCTDRVMDQGQLHGVLPNQMDSISSMR